MNCLRCLDKGKIFYGKEGPYHILLQGFKESPKAAIKEIAALLAIIGAIGILLIV